LSYRGTDSEAHMHIAGISDKELAGKVGDQTMVRIAVQGIESMYAEYQKREEKCTPMVGCKPSPRARKSSARLTPMACA